MRKGFFHTLSVSLIVAFSLLAPVSAPAQSTIVSNLNLDNSGIINSFGNKQKILGVPYSSNRLKGSSRRKFTPRNKSTVRLHSKFPRALGIINHEIAWTIKSLDSRKSQSARGKSVMLKLSPGKYSVIMTINKYVQKKTVTVHKSRNNVQSITIPIKAGVLKVNTGSSKASSLKNASVKVINSRGNVVATSKGKSIKRLLKSGRYTIDYQYGSAKKGRNMINITDGKVKEANIKMPASGKVRISATEKNNQPLMKSTSWIITDSSGKTVEKTKRHNLRLSLFPGTYTAHLSVAGKKRKSKKFKVRSGKSSEVTLRL